MAEIESVLDNLVHRELRFASNHATRATIKLRVLLKIMDMLDIPLTSLYDTKNLIRVDVSCSREIETIWYLLFDKKYPSMFLSDMGNNGSSSASSSSSTMTTSPVSHQQQQQQQPTVDESTLMEKFLAKDFVRSNDLSKIFTMLSKKYHAYRDIWHVLAIDGLYPSRTNGNAAATAAAAADDFKLYYDHLSISLDPLFNDNVSDNHSNETYILQELRRDHVRAIRTIYMKIEEANPTIIAKVLRKLFKITTDPISTKPGTMNATTTTNTTTINNTSSRCHAITAACCNSSDSESEKSNSLVENNMDLSVSSDLSSAESIGSWIQSTPTMEMEGDVTIMDGMTENSGGGQQQQQQQQQQHQQQQQQNIENMNEEKGQQEEEKKNKNEDRMDVEKFKHMRALEHRIECCYRFVIPDKMKRRAIAEWKRKELAQLQILGKRNKGATDKRKNAKKMKLTHTTKTAEEEISENMEEESDTGCTINSSSNNNSASNPEGKLDESTSTTTTTSSSQPKESGVGKKTEKKKKEKIKNVIQPSAVVVEGAAAAAVVAQTPSMMSTGTTESKQSKTKEKAVKKQNPKTVKKATTDEEKNPKTVKKATTDEEK